ncbi:MAG: hypothetical protein ABI360_09075, partial [Allobranchiibius sp.]
MRADKSLNRVVAVERPVRRTVLMAGLVAAGAQALPSAQASASATPGNHRRSRARVRHRIP